MNPPGAPMIPGPQLALEHPSWNHKEPPSPACSNMRGFTLQFPARSSLAAKILRGEVDRDLAVHLLWRAFPEPTSDTARAKAAEPYLSIGWRQIYEVLQKRADLKSKDFMVLWALGFGESLLDRVFGPENNI